jgi:SAM-dependent methyltransferase
MSEKPTKEQFFKAVGAQLQHPKGDMGRGVASKMNLTNRAMTKATYKMVKAQPGETILEIGFGNGQLMPELLDQITQDGQLFGVDVSADMVSQACEFLDAAGYTENFQLYQTNSTSLPIADERLDAVVAINVAYFWQDAIEHLQEIRRALNSNGRLVIAVRGLAYMQAMPFGKDGFVLREDSDYRDLLHEADFQLLDEARFIDDQLGEIKVDAPAEVILFLAQPNIDS